METRKVHIVLSMEDYVKLKVFLKSIGISFEPSGYGSNVYIALDITEGQRNIIDEFLQESED